jgi:hypothetical protein
MLFFLSIGTILIPTLGLNASTVSDHKDSMRQVANAHKCTYPHTTFYVYTEPIQKECVLLMHNGHVVNAEGRPIK